MSRLNYLDRIARAKDRYEAADLIRAFGCYVVADAGCMPPEQRLSLLQQHNLRAEQLEGDFSHDPDGNPIDEQQHPWRRWVRGWGYC